MDWVARYKQNRWPIVRVSGRAMHRFAIRFVLAVAAGKQRGQFLTDHDSVLRKVKKVRQLWFVRAKELMATGLWTPGGGVTKASSDTTARRCLFCRPSFLFYAGGNTKRLRPCQHTRFCPFCYARTAAFTYWNVRRYINTRRKVVDDEIVTCIVARQYVDADGFCEQHGVAAGMLTSNVKKLKAVIAAHCAAYDKKAKALQRHTSGSMWAIVVEPTKRGWRVESRQFMMGRAGARLPRAEILGAEVTYMTSARISDFVPSTKVLGRFVRYPKKLLTGYVELAAVALQAMAHARLRRGTGRFQTSGRGLVTLYKKTRALERKRKQAGDAQEEKTTFDS